MDIKGILRTHIKEECEIGNDPDFTDDVHLFDSGFLDSLGATELIQKDLILHPMNTVDEIALVIEEKLN